MTNEYIEVVKRWLADNDSVSSEELRANVDAARDDAYAYAYAAVAFADHASRAAVRAAATAAHYAYQAANAAAANGAANDASADHWVKRYEELTNDK
tara:strand:+ start:198 stop:488 length:291 start_codon:yes stop_codon:yes gene_type:complete